MTWGLRCCRSLFHHSYESALMTFPKNQAVSKRLLATTTALILMAVFAGCSSDNEEDPDNTVETSDAETEYVPASADGPAQNVPEPNLPAVATENTEEGAEATLKYFWEAVDHARLTGDTDPLAQVSHESCEFCDVYIDGWQDRYDNGDWAVIRDPIQLEVLEVSNQLDESQQDEWTAIVFDLTESAAELYVDGEKDDEESVEEENTAQWIADLSYDGTSQRWYVEWAGHEESESSE